MDFQEILQTAIQIAERAKTSATHPSQQDKSYAPATAEQLLEWGWQHAPERGEGYEWQSPWPFKYRSGFNNASVAAPIIREVIQCQNHAELQKVAWKGHGSSCNKHTNFRIRGGYNSLIECDCWVKTMWERIKEKQYRGKQ